MASTGRVVGLLALVLWCVGAGGVGGGVERPAGPPELPDPTDALLALAPLPVDPQTEDHSPLSDREPPREDSPIAELQQYWYHSISGRDRKPPERVWRRLLDACRGRPGRLTELLRVLPGTPEVVARVEAILEEDRAIPRGERLSEDEGPGSWNEKVRGWLAGKSGRFVPELESRAKALSGTEYGVERGEVLAELARDRWDLALPVLRRHARDGAPTLAALALGVMFLHGEQLGEAEREQVRGRLLEFANRKPHTVPNGVSLRVVGVPERATAIRALLAKPWSARDPWYLGLFSDKTLLAPTGSSGGYCSSEKPDPIDGMKHHAPCDACPDALLGPLVREPDRYVPLVAALLKQPGTSRDTAVWCFAALLPEHARPELLLALRPWIDDPTWCALPYERRNLWTALIAHPLPSFVEPLLAVAGRPCASGCVCDSAAALQVLEAWREPRVRPFVARRLESVRGDEAGAPASTWIALGGRDPAELAAVLEAASANGALAALGHQATQRVAEVVDASFREESTVDRQRWLRRQRWIDPAGLRDAVAARLVGRLRPRSDTPAETAARIRTTLLRWPAVAVDDYLIESLGNGTLNQSGLLRLLERRYAVRRARHEQLRALARGSGWTRGVATALLADRAMDEALVASADTRAQRAFVAVRRLMREPLTLAEVRALAAQPEPALRQALDRSVRDASGVPLAKVLATRPGTWPVLGATLDANWKREVANRTAGQMRAPTGGDELFVFATRSMIYRRRTSDTEPRVSTVCIQVRNGEASLELDRGDQRPSRVAFASEDLEKLRRFVASNGIDGLPFPTDERYGMGADHLYLHFRGGAARAIAMHYEQLGGCGTPLNRHHDVYDWLLGEFSRLERGVDRAGRARTDAAGRPIEVLLPPREGAERAFGFLEQPRRETVWKRGAELLVLETNYEAHRGRWLPLTAGVLGAPRPQPEACPYLGYRGWTEPERPLPGDNTWFVRHGWSDGLEQSPVADWAGLWHQPPGAEAARVLAACGLRPVVTAGGRWVVIEGEKNVVVHDLARRIDRAVPIPGNWACSVHGPTPDGRVLVRRYQPEAAWWSMDPANGHLTRERGELEPYLDGRWRAFQAAREPGHVWVALDGGRIGLYDPVKFRFTETNRYPDVNLRTMSMWVDEDEDRVYAVEGDAVLGMPLHATGPRR